MSQPIDESVETVEPSANIRDNLIEFQLDEDYATKSTFVIKNENCFAIRVSIDTNVLMGSKAWYNIEEKAHESWNRPAGTYKIWIQDDIFSFTKKRWACCYNLLRWPCKS